MIETEKKPSINTTNNSNKNSINFEVNKKILAIITICNTHRHNLPKSLTEQCEKYESLKLNDVICLDAIKELSTACRYLVKNDTIPDGKYYIHEILSGSAYVPIPLKPKVLSTEYLKFREQLTVRAENIRYEKMISNVKIVNKEEAQLKELAELKTVKSSLSIMTNIFAAAATLFVVFYFIGYNMSKQHSWALTLGVLGAIVGFLVEAILFIIRATELDTYQEKAKKRKDKQMAKTYDAIKF